MSYTRHGYAANQQNSDLLITKHAPLVKRIAYHLISRLPSSVHVDDLIQAGMIGLLEASRQFNPGQGATFETYAGIRIRGSMLDEVRRSDWTPRSVHKKTRMVSEAIRKIEGEKGRDARPDEIAKQLNITIDEYYHILQDASTSQIFSIEELTSDSQASSDNLIGDPTTPLDGLTKIDFKKALAKSIGGLPEREQLVVALYYDEELNLKEIGAVLEISESRVSQILSQAMIRLRSRLTEWLNKD